MEMNLKIEIQPFSVPNYILSAKEGAEVGELSKWHLKDVDVDTLSKLCLEFRREVFEKAGKADPMLPQKRAQIKPIIAVDGLKSRSVFS